MFVLFQWIKFNIFILFVSFQIRSILVSRASCTLSEFRADYEELIGDDLLPPSNDEIRDLLLTIPGVFKDVSKIGTEFWRVESENTVHIADLVKKQRRSHRTKRLRSRLNYCENAAPPSRSRVRRMMDAEPKGKTQKREGYYYDHQLMGDDFLLCIAKMDLGYSMNKGNFTPNNFIVWLLIYCHSFLRPG